MLKEQKNLVYVFGIMAILGISLATPVAKAALDIERISMCSQKDHLDGIAVSVPWRFEVDIHLGDPGTLHYITVTPPTGGMTSFTIYEDSGDWEYHSSPTLYPKLKALQKVYPTGLYTFDFCDSSDSLIKSVQLDYSGIDEPGSPVDFTYPSYNGQTGISTNPTLTWTVNSGAGDALGMSLKDETYWPVPMETLSWQPGPLDPEQNYWLYVTVIRVKDWADGPGLPTMTVGDDEFEYGLHIGYMNKIGFTTGEPQELTISIDIKPETLNLKSKGVFTAFIDLPEGFDEEDIDISTVECEGAPAVSGVMADDGRLIVKFDREDLVGVLPGDAVELTVTGELTNGTPFAGSDTIRVIDKGGKK